MTAYNRFAPGCGCGSAGECQCSTSLPASLAITLTGITNPGAFGCSGDCTTLNVTANVPRDPGLCTGTLVIGTPCGGNTILSWAFNVSPDVSLTVDVTINNATGTRQTLIRFQVFLGLPAAGGGPVCSGLGTLNVPWILTTAVVGATLLCTTSSPTCTAVFP